MGCSSSKSYASDSVAKSSQPPAVARESSKDAVYLKQVIPKVDGDSMMIFQLGTNNWQRAKKDGSGLEFAPGSGVLHEAHHNAYNALEGVSCFSMYPSKNQAQPTDDATYRVFELEHDIPICESASPNSSKRWHSMDDAEFGAYVKRLENEVYEYTKACEAKTGKKFSMFIAHDSFVNPLVLSRVIARRVAEGLPRRPLYCFVHGAALKMYQWELGGKNPSEFPLRFHKMICEQRLFDDIEKGVDACFVISQEQRDSIAKIFPTFPQDRVIVAPDDRFWHLECWQMLEATNMLEATTTLGFRHRSTRAHAQSSSRTRECRAPEDLAPRNPGARAPGHSRPKSSRPKSPRSWASEHRRLPSTVGLSELTSIREWPSGRRQSGTWAKYSTNPNIRAYHQSRI